MCRKKLCLNFRSETKITRLRSLQNFWVVFAVHLSIPPNKLCVGFLSEVVLIPIFKLVSSNDYILKQRSKESVLSLCTAFVRCYFFCECVRLLWKCTAFVRCFFRLMGQSALCNCAAGLLLPGGTSESSGSFKLYFQIYFTV